MLRGLKDNSLNPVTEFEHPYPQMKNLYKEMLTYKRNDGIDLIRYSLSSSWTKA